MKKRILAAFVAAVMALALALPALALPTREVISGSCGENLTWTLDTETGVLTISGTGAMDTYFWYDPAPWENYAITSLIVTDGVTSIGGHAFEGCNLTSVELPDSLIGIGEGAFMYCLSLQSIKLPESLRYISTAAFSMCYSLTSVEFGSGLEYIGDYAFEDCYSLTSVELPDSPTEIDEYAFAGCRSLISVDFGSGLTSIGEYAFIGCTAITSFELPGSLTEISEMAFIGCVSLNEITVSEGNNSFCALDGVLFDKACETLLLYPQGRSSDSYTVPEGVTSIGGFAFFSASCVEGDYTYSYCSALTSVEFPDSLTSIDWYAFCGCDALTSVEFPDSLTNIDECAFEGCSSLTSVKFGSGLTSLGINAFRSCSSLTSVELPESLTSVGMVAFAFCSSLSSAVFMGEPPTEFGYSVFMQCAEDFCIYYNEAYASAWAPNGETEWNGYPIALYEGPAAPSGDVNDDENIDVTDALLVLRYALGLMTDLPAIEAADVNGSGVVDLVDALLILRLAMGIIPSL